MHHSTDRITNITALKDRSDDPSHHERTLLPRSYISLPKSLIKFGNQHFFFNWGGGGGWFVIID